MSRLGQYVATFNNALGFYTNALTAIAQDTFDLRLLDDLMQPVAELVNFAETFRRMAKQVLLRQEHRKETANAAAIQRAFLPEYPHLPGHLDLHAEMVSAKEIGGDLYDFFLIDEQSLVIIIGDVSGKGTPAALFMAAAQSVLRLVLRQAEELERDPEKWIPVFGKGSRSTNEIERDDDSKKSHLALGGRIRAANEFLMSINRESLFATMFCGVLHLATGRLTYCNCGHNPPLLLRKGVESLQCLTRTGRPLGLLAGSKYSSQTVTLTEDDCLVLFTDGITEALNDRDETYGDARLANVIRGNRDLASRDLIGSIFDSVRQFTGGLRNLTT
jgi:sigma-B regulation protein RsbU (phosphoserine phosphatase)